jgi:hypothetical protein
MTKKSKKKVIKNVGILQNSTYINDIVKKYNDSTILDPTIKLKKVYTVSVPIGGTVNYIDRLKNYRFYCTSIVIEYSLSGYLGSGGTTPIYFYDNYRNNSFLVVSAGYTKKTIEFGTLQPANQLQIIFDPPLLFENPGQGFYPTISVGMDSAFTLSGTDYLHSTLMGYEEKL